MVTMSMGEHMEFTLNFMKDAMRLHQLMTGEGMQCAMVLLGAKQELQEVGWTAVGWTTNKDHQFIGREGN
jgi:hypothetical protein